MDVSPTNEIVYILLLLVKVFFFVGELGFSNC
jgi:hypothetical protein